MFFADEAPLVRLLQKARRTLRESHALRQVQVREWGFGRLRVVALSAGRCGRALVHHLMKEGVPERIWKFGRVARLPGGDQLVSKQIELLKAIIPGITRLGVLTTGGALSHDDQMLGATKAAQVLKLKLIEVRVSAPGDLARLESICGKGACQALYVMQDPQMQSWRAQIVEWAARLQLPTVSSSTAFTENGALMSYSSNIPELYRRAATFVDKILRGAKPGDLPIEQPTKFELVVNQKTAKALGIKISDEILLRADRVIE